MIKEVIRKGNQYVDILKLLVVQTAGGIISFMLANSIIFEDFAPFGVAFTSALPLSYTPISAIGAVLGYMISGEGEFKYIAAVLLAISIRWFFSGFLGKNGRNIMSATVAFVSVATLGILSAVMSDANPINIVYCLGDALLSGGAAYFFSTTFDALSKDTAHTPFSEIELTSAIISAMLCLMAIYPLTIADISIPRIVAIMVVLISARYGRAQGGAISGICAGLTLCVSNKDMIFAAAGMSLGGLMSGVLGATGRFGTAVAFVLANGIVCVGAYNGYDTLIFLYEVAIATALFVIIPKSITSKVSKMFVPPAELHDADGMRENVVMRLKFASDALGDVASTVENVSEKLSKMETRDFNSVFTKTEDKVCSRCGLRIYCWETSRGQTLTALLSAVKSLRNHNSVSADDFPKEFLDKCAHPEKILEALSNNFSAFMAAEAADKRLNEVRTVISEQMDGMSQMLFELAKEFEEAYAFDPITASRLETALRAARITPTDIACQIDKYGRLSAEIRMEIPVGERVNRAILLRELSKVSDREFDIPTVTKVGSYCLLTLNEKAVYNVDFGIVHVNSEGNTVCGDAASCFVDTRGRAVMILSDGMGSGGRAAVDGTMACGLMTRLIKAGFGMDCALRVVNSAMMYKSRDESLATLDVTVIDLFSGATEFYKAGAPETIVCRKGKTCIVEGETLPAGILQDVGFDKSELMLSKGDKIVMVSDGALSEGSDWIGVELEVFKNGTATDLAHHIADYAKRRAGNQKHRDDITVLTAIIE
ncbi:MAG: SpoIIE family protein phosphatase [Clostridia bacterium]|nr:SpoIIE family protein phosphatase [Clostridia bacterium]